MAVGPFQLTRPKREHWLWAYGFFFVIFVCLFFYRYLEKVAWHSEGSPWVQIIEEGTGMFAAAAFFPILHEVTIRFPPIGKNWWRYVPVHACLLVAYSATKTTFMYESRRFLFPLFGLGEYQYGDLRVRYFMEGAEDVRGYLGLLTLIFLYHYFRYSAQQELARARLEALLAQAQVQNLRLQLEPHFLFNALNAISAVVYEDPRKADKMISRLSDLLRHLLKQDHEQEIPLGEEIELIRLYTNVMEARLEDRLKVQIERAEGAECALVPQLVLQPIVENAIKYGASPSTFQVDVKVTARLDNGDLRLTVRDHGPGWPKGHGERHGIGIRNTEERLAKLYGSEDLLRCSNPEGGGAQVEIRVPFHTEAQPMAEAVTKPA